MKELLSQLAAFFYKYKHIAEQDDAEHIEDLLEQHMDGEMDNE